MKLLLASAAALSMTAAASAADLTKRQPAPPAPAASSGMDGFGSLALGYNWWSGDFGPNANGLHVNARGSFFAPVSGSIGFQLDGSYERNAYGSGEAVEHAGTVAGHIFTRNTTGLFGAIAQTTLSTTTGDNSGDGDTRFFLGAEGQYFVNNAVTLYGQAAYQSFNAGSTGFDGASFTADGFSGVAQARFFAAENVMLVGKVAYEYGKLSFGGPSTTVNSWAVAGKGVYHIHHTPVSVFAEAQYRASDFNPSGLRSAKEHETRGLVGVKYSFTSKSLLERDRTGASLDPIEVLATRPAIDFFSNR